jgi:Uma2 family endonuclease
VLARPSPRRARGPKLSLYARAGIPEVWIVDVEEDAVEVYRNPAGDTYRVARRHDREARVSPAALPDIAVAVTDLL